jgi:hypothetical protein
VWFKRRFIVASRLSRSTKLGMNLIALLASPRQSHMEVDIVEGPDFSFGIPK